MKQQRQAGFSLVEMMIAMSLGLLVLLGATQAYQAIRLSFDRLQALSTLQSSLTFTSDTLLRDVRRARQIDTDPNQDPVEYVLHFSDGSNHRYRLSGPDDDATLELDRDDDEWSPLATDLRRDTPLLSRVGDAAHGAWEISLTFRDGANHKTHSFMAVQRYLAVTPDAATP